MQRSFKIDIGNFISKLGISSMYILTPATMWNRPGKLLIPGIIEFISTANNVGSYLHRLAWFSDLSAYLHNT